MTEHGGRRSWRGHLASLLVAGLAAGCSSGSDGMGGPGPIVPPPPPVPTNAVDVADNRFSPVQAAVAGGTAVIWTWRGSNQHNVTFEDGQGSSTTKTTGDHQRQFQATGTFRYRCTIHSVNFDSGMIGTVIVN